jgi:hypothetical protein
VNANSACCARHSTNLALQAIEAGGNAFQEMAEQIFYLGVW